MTHPTAFRSPSRPAAVRYLALTQVADPPADALAQAVTAGTCSHEEAMKALRALTETPLWVDTDRQRVACEAFQRTGILSGIVLAMYSLPLAYLSPAGVKPLTLSGRLVEKAPRRLAETLRFILEVTRPGGMLPGAAGHEITLRVRLMHAIARIHTKRHWDAEAWGEPISQAHLASTNLLFSLHCVDGLRKLGIRWSQEEVEGFLHLWRHIGWTLGIQEALLCSTEAEARHLWALVRDSEGQPDEDGRALTQALLTKAVPTILASILPVEPSDPRFIKLIQRLSTALLGRDTARMLGVPEQSGPLLITPMLRLLVGGVESVRHAAPGGDTLMRHLGASLNDWLVTASLDGKPAQFVA